MNNNNEANSKHENIQEFSSLGMLIYYISLATVKYFYNFLLILRFKKKQMKTFKNSSMQQSKQENSLTGEKSVKKKFSLE